MLRRKPTRLELKEDDLSELINQKKEQAQRDLAAGIPPKEIKKLTVHERIGYVPKGKEQR